MKILALELSTARGSLAWLHPPSQFMRQWPNDRKNSAGFFANLDAVIKKFGPPETIVVGLGPGSYAGTRIAISAATGLRISSDARLLGYPSICAMECDATEYGVIGDARRKSFFFARVRENRLVEGPELFSETELNAKLEGVGRTLPIFSSETLPQFGGVRLCFPSALVLARLALEPERGFSVAPLEPIYLRGPHVTIPK